MKPFYIFNGGLVMEIVIVIGVLVLAWLITVLVFLHSIRFWTEKTYHLNYVLQQDTEIYLKQMTHSLSKIEEDGVYVRARN